MSARAGRAAPAAVLERWAAMARRWSRYDAVFFAGLCDRLEAALAAIAAARAAEAQLDAFLGAAARRAA